MGKAGGNSKLQVSRISVCLPAEGGVPNHQRCSVAFPSLILAELMAGCCQVLVPCQGGSILPQHPWLLGAVTFLPPGKAEGKPKKDQTNSCCCCTAQEVWSIYQFEQASHFANLNRHSQMSAASPSCRRVTQLLLCGITEITEHTEPRRNQSNTLLWAVFFRHTWLPYSQITGLRKTCQRIWRWIRTERLILQTAELNSGFNVSPEISKVGLKDVTPYWLPPVFNFSFSSALQQIDMNNSIITTSPGLQPQLTQKTSSVSWESLLLACPLLVFQLPALNLKRISDF